MPDQLCRDLSAFEQSFSEPSSGTLSAFLFEVAQSPPDRERGLVFKVPLQSLPSRVVLRAVRDRVLLPRLRRWWERLVAYDRSLFSGVTTARTTNLVLGRGGRLCSGSNWLTHCSSPGIASTRDQLRQKSRVPNAEWEGGPLQIHRRSDNDRRCLVSSDTATPSSCPRSAPRRRWHLLGLRARCRPRGVAVRTACTRAEVCVRCF